MPLSANLEASFGAGGFDLSAGLTGLGDLFGGVALPTLALDGSTPGGLDGLTLEGVLGSVGDLGAVVGGALEGMPDLAALLGPLEAATAILDLVGRTDFVALSAQVEAALRPPEPSLAALVSTTAGLGAVPGVGALADALSGLGLDLRAPGALLGGAAGGILSLVQLVGALMGVEAASAEIERRLALAADVLEAERLASLVTRIRASGGGALAGLLAGVDPDEPGVVEVVAAPIEAYVALVHELVTSTIRNVAYAEATVVHADFPALVAELGVASAGLHEGALAPVRELVASAGPLVGLIASIDVPAVGPPALVEASATIAGRLEALVDAVAPTAVSGLLEPVLGPVLTPVREVQAIVDEVVGALDAAFRPVREALAAIDLAPVEDALEAVTAPVREAVDTIAAALSASQADVEAAVTAVVAALSPLQAALTSARDAIAVPFGQVHGLLVALDLGALQERLRTTIEAVAAAVGSAPVRPVFDVASGVLSTAADALGLVPRALLPDDVRSELEAACGTIQAIDLEPTRGLLHDELGAIVLAVDTGALSAAQAGYAAVQEFVASIDPAPLVHDLEAQAFATLAGKLDALDPAALLAGPIAALDEVRHALDDIDLAALLAPVEDALDAVRQEIASLDPAVIVAPVAEALAGIRATISDTLHLDTWTTQLASVDHAVASLLERVDAPALVAEVQARWSALLAPLRTPGPPLAAALLGGLLGPASSSAGGSLLEVLAWARGERDGARVVHERLGRAAARAAATVGVLEQLDLRTVGGELTHAYEALTAAIAALPEESTLRARLEGSVAATDPRPDLALLTAGLPRVVGRFGEASAVLSATMPPDRSEVAVIAAGLGTAFLPLAPAGATARRLLGVVGVGSLEHGLGPALASALESIGPGPLLAPFAAVVAALERRLADLVHDGVVEPLTAAVGELRQLLDALGVDGLLAGIEGVRTELLGLVDTVRPSVVLAAPIGAFTAIRETLRGLDPLAPVRAAVDTLRATVDVFTTEFAPTRLLAPVTEVYDDLAALVGSFDVAALLEPVIGALQEIQRQLDEGMDEVIDALSRLQSACASDGGQLPGLDLALSASVDVGGGLGL